MKEIFEIKQPKLVLAEIKGTITACETMLKEHEGEVNRDIMKGIAYEYIKESLYKALAEEGRE